MAKYRKQVFFLNYFDIAMSHVQRTEERQRQALHVWPVRLRLVNQPGARGIRDDYDGRAGDGACVCESMQLQLFTSQGWKQGDGEKVHRRLSESAEHLFQNRQQEDRRSHFKMIFCWISLQHDNAEFYIRWYCWRTVTIKRLTFLCRPCSFSLGSHLWNQYCKCSIIAISI